ncbi:MAG: hypothetical protein K1X89_28090 [Myxococcaceae bacterium]|nr:hypothetical protein [Myxococcaceae bacterium]
MPPALLTLALLSSTLTPTPKSSQPWQEVGGRVEPVEIPPSHFAGAFLGGVTGAAPTLVLELLAIDAGSRNAEGSVYALAGLATLPLALLGPAVGGALAGDDSPWGARLAAGVLPITVAGLAGLAGLFPALLAVVKGVSPAVPLGVASGAGLLVGALWTATILEGHERTAREESGGVRLAVAPRPGGAEVSASLAW